MNRWQRAVRKLQLARWDEPMLRPQQYEIVFDAPGGVYFAEEMVTGHVLLEMRTPVRLKGVKLRFKGECFVHFTDAPLIRNPKSKWKHKSEDDFFDDDAASSSEKIGLDDRGKGGPKWLKIFGSRKHRRSVTPLSPSPSPSLDFSDGIKPPPPHRNGISNGKVNHGYVPDSAVTNVSGLQWSSDVRNGNVVHSPPDKMSMVQDVGAGHTHGLASRIIKHHKNYRPPRRLHPPPSRQAHKKKSTVAQSKSSSSNGEVLPKQDSEDETTEKKNPDVLGVSVDATSTVRESMNLLSQNNLDSKSNTSQLSQITSSLSGNDEGESLSTNPSENEEEKPNKPIFTIEQVDPESSVPTSSKSQLRKKKRRERKLRQSHSSVDSEESVKSRGTGIFRKSLYERPQSSISTWRENTIKGPTFHYWAKETYFDCEFYIYGHKYQKDEKEMLQPGVYEFPFAFNLPPNLPPSFSSEKGVIRYVVAAILDRPAAANLVRKKAFSVHSLLDLNMDSHAASNISRSKSKNLCGLFCDNGPITLSARLPKRGYVPGEKIIVDAEADNISGRSTKRTRLMLLQIITYIMPNDVKTIVEKRIVKEIVRGMILPGESDLWEGVAITVPPLAPDNLHLTARLIKLDYKIEMVMELPKPWKELRVTLPISIGSVPLRQNFKDLLPQPETLSQKQPKLSKVNYADFPAYYFAECYFGRETLEEQYERLTGEVDDLGPQYEAVHPFAPSYIAYTTGQMVHASQLAPGIETRPSTTAIRSRTDSKNSSLGSKSSRVKDRRELWSTKKTAEEGTGGQEEKNSQERLAMNVISKMAADSEIRRRRSQLDKQNATEAINAIINGTKKPDISNENENNKEVDSNNKVKDSEASGEYSSVLDNFDFDKANEQNKHLEMRGFPVNKVKSNKFKATKITNKGSFKGDISMDELSVLSQ